MTPEQIAEIRERLRCKYYGEWSERATDDIAALLAHIDESDALRQGIYDAGRKDAYAALTPEVLDAAIEALSSCIRGPLGPPFHSEMDDDSKRFEAARAALTRLKEAAGCNA